MIHYFATTCENLQPNGLPYPINSKHCNSVVGDPVVLPNHLHTYAGIFVVVLALVAVLIFLQRRKK